MQQERVALGSAAVAVGSGGGAGSVGLNGSGSQGTGQAQGNGHMSAAGGIGGSADGGAGLWNSRHGRRALELRAKEHGIEGGHGRGYGGNVNGNEVPPPPFL